MRIAVIIPACDEQECIVAVLEELRHHAPPEKFIVAVGVNGSSDRTAELAREAGVIVAETEKRGYGHGCQAAIAALEEMNDPVAGYIFVAADGANDPADIPKLIGEYERGVPIVLGARTHVKENHQTMGKRYVLANRFLGLACGLLAGRFFYDLGPLRFIERETYFRLAMQELTYGWTAEAQVVAGRLGIPQVEVAVRERPRLAGRQKVSRVSWMRTVSVGCAILSAALRSYARAGSILSRSVRVSDSPVPVLPPAR